MLTIFLFVILSVLFFLWLGFVRNATMDRTVIKGHLLAGILIGVGGGVTLGMIVSLMAPTKMVFVSEKPLSPFHISSRSENVFLVDSSEESGFQEYQYLLFYVRFPDGGMKQFKVPAVDSQIYYKDDERKAMVKFYKAQYTSWGYFAFGATIGELYKIYLPQGGFVHQYKEN